MGPLFAAVAMLLITGSLFVPTFIVALAVYLLGKISKYPPWRRY